MSKQWSLQLDDLNAFFGSALPVKLAYALRHRPDLIIANEAIVDLNYAGEFAHRSGAEYFVRAVNIVWRQVRFDAADFFGCADFDDRGAGDPFGTGDDAAGGEIALSHDEDVGRVRFGNETATWSLTSMVSSFIAIRLESAPSIQWCRVAMPFGKDCSFTAVAFSNCTSISIGCIPLRLRFLLSKFRPAKQSSRKSNALLPLTRCGTAFIFA